MKSVFTRKSKLEIPLPQGWHQVTFNKAIDVIEQNYTSVELLAVLSDLDPKEISKATDHESIYYLVQSLLFLQDIPKAEMPSKAMGVSIPDVDDSDRFDLGKATVGQVEDMKMVLQSRQNELKDDLAVIKIYPEICAIYLQPLVLKKEYDYDAAMLYAKHLESNCDFKTIVSMGAFFLWRLSDLTSGLMKDKQKRPTRKRKLKQAFRSLGRLLGFMRR